MKEEYIVYWTSPTGEVKFAKNVGNETVQLFTQKEIDDNVKGDKNLLYIKVGVKS